MKANELRIGNYIKFHNTITKVEVFSIWDNLIQSDNFAERQLKDFEPILLTEEWLLKFGFSNREGFSYNEWFIGFNPITHDWMFDICWLVGHDYPFYRNGHFAIKYVHQLQNLYFALTGEELTIKENE